jgi:hypothetical protein
MTKAAKTRALLLLMATFSTLLALTPPKRAQACIPWEVDYCIQSNGVSCAYSECSSLNHCDGTQDPSKCVYWTEQCCR